MENFGLALGHGQSGHRTIGNGHVFGKGVGDGDAFVVRCHVWRSRTRMPSAAPQRYYPSVPGLIEIILKSFFKFLRAA